ncbi:MAG: hypothetical protein ABI779_20350 [Acidobacteriota bacterium]
MFWCLTIALALSLAGGARAGVNQWTIIGPPLEVRTMAIDPDDADTLYTAGFDQVARSTDRGATWTLRAVPGMGAAVAIRVSESISSTVYVLSSSGLYRSTNGGDSWTARKVPTSGQFPQDLQIDGRNSNILVLSAWNFCFFGCTGGGVYRSEDGGGSWKRIGFKDENATSVALDPISTQILYAISEKRLFTTRDGGRSWTVITPEEGGDPRGVVVDPVIATTIYAATDGGVFRSDDSGHSWSLVRQSFGATLARPASRSREIFATAAGAVRSANQGAAWRELSTRTSGFIFSSLWELAFSADTYYMVTDLQTRPGQILVYELRQPRSRAVRP